MARFVRKNEIVCTGTFTATDGSGAVPLNAEAVLTYTNVSGATETDQIELAQNTVTGVWSGVWDSSNAQEGVVEWMIHCWNGLQAASQGSFYIVANKANTV
jgi:hypothetical protein